MGRTGTLAILFSPLIAPLTWADTFPVEISIKKKESSGGKKCRAAYEDYLDNQ